jgi:LPS-assembly protein
MTLRPIFKLPKIAALWSLALIISSGILKSSFAADSPQLTFGDKLSVFSDKAYRKNGGKYFEAVGNVIIISQKDTIYGELASLDQETMMVKIEGNVRIITKDMTLYGSHLEYNITTGAAEIKNARILTSDFNLVSNRLIRVNENEYITENAEFTTCKDCAESWSVYGKKIRLVVGKYVQITSGLFKVKGVNVIYIPYIVLPILTKRKSGLLMFTPVSRSGEGIGLQQPVFWAIDDHKDATITPSFWGKRGYGTDLQYRQRFKDMTWMDFNTRLLNDTIYEPKKANVGPSGETTFRHFSEFESHQQWTSNLGSHLRYTGSRDLDILKDYPTYVDPRTIGSDFGLQGKIDYRHDLFHIGTDGQYLRNNLHADAMDFDRSYVQVLPRVSLSTVPFSVVQSRTPMFQHISTGIDSSYTRFRQVDKTDTPFLRNADRISLQPYINWNLFTWGPVSLKTRYQLDQQVYLFDDHHEASAGKNAGLMKTEVSFTMDKIFGLAYQERIPLKYISEEDLKRLRDNKEQGLRPIQKSEKENRLIGDLPKFETDLAQESLLLTRNGYRHAQEFKFLHHYITSQNTYGNKQFINQINQGQAGWSDYEDAIRSKEFLSGSTATRTIIPPANTLEFQWNNTLIRKSPKPFNYLVDDKFLRDNFTYTKIGYFNVSQGYMLQKIPSNDINDRLTRLQVETGYIAQKWNVAMNEYYFHKDSKNIFTLSGNRRFEYLNVFAGYNYNAFPKKLDTIIYGGQVRPTDILGLAYSRQDDLLANKNINTTYSVDIMPNNNCWILNLNYQKTINLERYTFGIMFNFGDDRFERMRNDYFAVKRL